VRYRVDLQRDAASEPIVVDLVELPSGALGATIAGRPVDIDVVKVDRHLSVRVDGRIVELTARGSLPDLEITGGGSRARVRVESDRTGSPSRPRPRASEPKAVRSPMPGRVIRIAVAPGATVRAGQSLVVLEAMKMENEVVAAWPGTVLEIHVEPGSTIEANAKLVTLAETADSGTRGTG